jgi:hypothetical protein
VIAVIVIPSKMLMKILTLFWLSCRVLAKIASFILPVNQAIVGLVIAAGSARIGGDSLDMLVQMRIRKPS